MTNEKKSIIIRVDEDLHKRLKVYTACKRTTIQKYVKKLIEEDLKKSEKNLERI